MTEAEALTRWCPFARTAAYDYDEEGRLTAVSINRDYSPDIQGHCLCIASACMMWQTYESETYLPPTVNPPDSEGWAAIAIPSNVTAGEQRWVRQEGRCGLANR